MSNYKKLGANPSRSHAAKLVMTSRSGTGSNEATLEEEMNLPTRDSFHLTRKLFHFLTGFGFAVAYSNLLTRDAFIKMFGLMAILVFVMENLRLRSKAVNKMVSTLFKPFMRQHELSKFSGMAYYLSGCAVAATICSKHAAVIGILLLSLLDPVAAFFGTLLSKYSPNMSWTKMKHGKSIVGGFAAFVIALILMMRIALVAPVAANSSLAQILTANQGMSYFKTAVAVAAVGALTELGIPSPQITLPYQKFPLGIDDNFWIPIAVALAVDRLLPVAAFPFAKFLLF
eukprot:CAMPEP_0184700386 /NCGR_PEP_ID=MMETSP0313-20130426/12870_1 /TAXON_ID=2792 /ORGANISM="Porphyridium aerugineum, Strain SAG 1380-2" /LENGTH=285 /DNA_ID=CAMNT_0027160033 /DNA_START=183 /DNA_END=1040 /DNA_ORIENTATION=-